MFGTHGKTPHGSPETTSRLNEIEREVIAARQMVESKFMALTSAMNLRDDAQVDKAMKDLVLYYETYVSKYVDGYFEKIDLTENFFSERKPKNET